MQDSRHQSFDYDQIWTAWADMKQYGPMSRHTRRLIWRLIGDLSFRSALDVGCGEGSPLEELAARRPGVELTGVDISPEAVELARQRLPSVSFSVLDLTRDHLPRFYDLVICTDVLEHIEDDVSALRNIRAMSSRWCLVSSLQGQMRGHEAHVGHVRNYRKGELRRKLEETGFTIRRQVQWGFPFYSPLYRDVLRLLPATATTGRFGMGRRLLSEALYLLFMANSWSHGDYIFCLAEVS